MSETRTILRLRIAPQSPLLLGNRSGGSNFQESLDRIPGSVLRGMVAEKLITACLTANGISDHDDCPDPDSCPFWQIFGGEQPYFRAAYPGGINGPVWPLPQTARTCKQAPGWESGKKKGHGISDVLLPEFAYALVTDPDYPLRATLQPDLDAGKPDAWQPALRQVADTCPECGEPVQPVKSKAPGYYTWGKPIQPAAPLRKQRMVHVGINRARSVAEDALLYTQESLHAADGGQHFHGEVAVPAGKAEKLATALSGTFHVGRGRTRGNGEIQVQVIGGTDFPSLSRRLSDFEMAAELLLDGYRQADERVTLDLPGRLFSLTLRTPAILKPPGVTAPVTAAAFGLPDDVDLLQSWTRTEMAGGWHSAARLPRRTQQAVAAGSAFLFFALATLAKETLLVRLALLEAEGVGLERERGFGQVTACAPFHTEQISKHKQG